LEWLSSHPFSIPEAAQRMGWLLSTRGLVISERALREKANRIGAFHRLGRNMIITADQIDQILEYRKPCPSNRSAEAPRGGRAGASNISAPPSPTTIDAALEHLKKQARGTGVVPRREANTPPRPRRGCRGAAACQVHIR
jgi:hypothetical protein